LSADGVNCGERRSPIREIVWLAQQHPVFRQGIQLYLSVGVVRSNSVN
jgi:hypothetical protein